MTDARRLLVARIATVLAVVALPLGMLSVWVSAYVGSTDRYVSTVRPLAEDQAVKDAAVAIIEQQTLAAMDNSDQVGNELRGLDLSCLGLNAQALGGIADLITGFLDSSGLSDQIRPYLAQAIHSGVVAAVDGPLFAQAWVTANRQAHEQVLAVLEDRAPAGSGDKVLIPLSQVADSFSSAFGCKNLIPAGVSPAFTLVDASDLRGARTGYQVLHPLAYVLPPLFLLALVVALVASPGRRRTTRELGIGCALGAGLLELVMLLVKHLVISDDSTKPIFDAIWGALTHGLTVSVVVVAVVSAAAAAATWLPRTSSLSRRS